MTRSVWIAGVAAFAVAGCLHTGDDKEVKPRSAKAEVTILDASKPDIDSLRSQRAGHPSDAALDGAVEARCAPPQDVKAFAVPAAVIAMVAGWVIDYAITEASQALRRRAAEYSAVSAGNVSFGPVAGRTFYSKVPAPLEMNWRCVRLVRWDKTPDGGRIVAAEAIVKIEVARAGDSLLITPLRLYFDRPLARTAGGSKFGVAVGATYDGLWRTSTTGEGKATRVWSATALSQKIENVAAGAHKRFYYFNTGRPDDTAENLPVQVPLVPWSLGSTGAAGNGTLTLTLAEAGDPPWVLTFFASVLKDHGGDIGKFLKDAASKAVGAE